MSLQVLVRLAVLVLCVVILYRKAIFLPFEASQEKHCSSGFLRPYSNRYTERDYSAGNSSLGVRPTYLIR